jgi:transposase
MVSVETEQDIERLRAFAQVSQRENHLLRRRLAELLTRLAEAEGVEQLELLQAELNKVQSALSSTPKTTSGSERRGGDRTKTGPSQPQTGHGPSPQPALPVIEEVLTLDEADRVCPQCGEELVAIDGQFEESELIDVVEVSYKIRKIQRQKYRCQCSTCQHIDTALPTEDRLMEGGRYSTNIAASIIHRKYGMHLPLTRQAKEMNPAGLNVSTNTLWDQLWCATLRLKPTWEALLEMQREQPVLGADESRWPLLDKRSEAKPSVVGLVSEKAVVYAIEMDKTAETLSQVLGHFSGKLVVDGISMYPKVQQMHRDGHINGTRDGPAFTLANCWVHARRNFIKAEPDFPEAAEMLDYIARLYRLAKGADCATVDDELRLVWIDGALATIRRWLTDIRPTPGTSLEQAVLYMDKYWNGLTAFREDRKVWLDNNATERALRAPVLGRKNHYGSRSSRGMETAAVMYTLIETCQLIGVEPRDYLEQALRATSRRPGTVFLPHRLLDSASK